jgi:antitoxin VapB
VDTAKLFANGQSQAVRLPKAYRFKGDRVYVRRMGDGVLLLPYQAGWALLREGAAQFSDDFMQTRNQPRQQARDVDFDATA